MTPIQYVTQSILEKIPLPQVPKAIEMVAPMIAEFAQSDAVLTDDRRAYIEVQILRTLRALGLEGSDSA